MTRTRAHALQQAPSGLTVAKAAAVVLQQLGHVLLADHPQRHCGSREAGRQGRPLTPPLKSCAPSAPCHDRQQQRQRQPGLLHLPTQAAGTHPRAGWSRGRPWSAGCGTRAAGPGSPGSGAGLVGSDNGGGLRRGRVQDETASGGAWAADPGSPGRAGVGSGGHHHMLCEHAVIGSVCALHDWPGTPRRLLGMHGRKAAHLALGDRHVDLALQHARRLQEQPLLACTAGSII